PARLRWLARPSPAPPPQRSTLFPYTTLFRSRLPARMWGGRRPRVAPNHGSREAGADVHSIACCEVLYANSVPERDAQYAVNFSGDRKSTRLNSSHVKMSYAVFCLKKKSEVED